MSDEMTFALLYSENGIGLQTLEKVGGQFCFQILLSLFEKTREINGTNLVFV